MLIIALTGHTGSGKSAVARYLSSAYHAHIRASSGPLRRIATALDLPHTRQVLQRLGDAVYMELGPDAIANALLQGIPDEPETLVVIDCFRYLNEAEVFGQNHPYVLIGVKADEADRIRRARKRRQNLGDEHLTTEQLTVQDGQPTEAQIPLLLEQAEYCVLNYGTLDELHAQVDCIMRRIRSSLVSTQLYSNR